MSPDAEAPKGPAQFKLVQIFVSKALFELTGDNFNIPRPPHINVNVGVGASIKLFADLNGAFVELDTKFTPDQQWQPYRVEVKMGAVFQIQGGKTEDLVNFCKVGAPSIMFPYIREIAHRLTGDAPAGPMRIDPMNISGLLNQSDWNVTQLTETDSTVPPPPSSQSTSASPESAKQP